MFNEFEQDMKNIEYRWKQGVRYCFGKIQQLSNWMYFFVKKELKV